MQATGKPYSREKPKPDELLADSLNNRAVSLFELGKKAEAELKWQEALRVDPHHPEATYNSGLIQWRSVRMTDQQLLTKQREVLASTAEPARVEYLTGLIHMERSDADAAVGLLNKAAGVGTGRAEITAALGLARAAGASAGQYPRIFKGHKHMVESVSFSPDGYFALSGSFDETLRLWEVSSARCIRTFEGHMDYVLSVSFSPDGQFALSGSRCNDTKALRLWEVASGKCLRTFEGHTGAVKSVSWSPDGRFALSVSGDSTLRLWEVSSGKCIRTFKGHMGGVNSVSFSPDGRFALSGGNPPGLREGEASVREKTLRLWEVSSGRCLRTFEGHTNDVTSVSWAPEGRFALSGGLAKTFRLW